MSPKRLNSQFKSPRQTQRAFSRHVKNGKLIENYTDPISGSKSYTNVKSKYSYNLDTGLPGRERNINAKSEAPHIDINYSNKVKYNTKKVKLHYNGSKEYIKR